MLFNSYIFIFVFLPIAIIGYFGLNKIKKYIPAKFFLVGMSLWFYAYFNLEYLWIILASIAVNYCCHRLMLLRNLESKPGVQKGVFIVGLLVDIGLLFYYKYFNFFIDNINSVFKMSIQVETILLPLGISFFTFQQIAFLVDTKRGKVNRQPLCDYMLFVTFFPQLIAGPIVSQDEMLPQFRNHELKKLNAQNLYVGLRIFILGLSKKILIADLMGQAVQWGYEHVSLMHGSGAALLILLYTLQIYFDFSGYCDMARGIGYMFNINLPVNFNSPYKAKNIIEFWNRWHMTLTRFFTGYLYIPLGGNRKGNLRTYINILIVFFISGIWHGAGYTFIVWGLLHGLINVGTRIFHKYKERFNYPGKNNALCSKIREVLAMVATFVCINLLWVFFRAESLTQALTLIAQLFDVRNSSGVGELASLFITSEVWYIFKIFKIEGMIWANYLPMFLNILLSVFVVWGCKNIAESEKKFKPTAMNCVVLSCLLLWCIVSLSNVSTFLYFNF